jgi:hypothetical protein
MATERQAENKGYMFTGDFSHDKEEIKDRAEKIRKDGYKAMVVSKPPDPLSRGHHGTGYSVYAERKFFIDRAIAGLERSLATFPKQFEEMKQRHEREIRELTEEKERREERLKKLEMEEV